MIETGLSKIQGIKVVQSMHTPKSSLHALKSQKISYWLCVSFCSVLPCWAFCGAVVGCVCVFFGIIENQFGWNRKRTLLKFEHAGSQRFVCVLAIRSNHVYFERTHQNTFSVNAPKDIHAQAHKYTFIHSRRSSTC